MTALDWTRRLARGAKPATVAVRSSVPLEQQAVTQLRDGSSPVDREHAAEFFTLLLQSPTGRDDVQLFVDQGITLAFDTRRGGAGYIRGAKLIVLNRTQVTARTALDFVHEVTHARCHVSRTGCDIDAQTQEQYVRSVLFEESQAYFREALVGRELIHRARDPLAVRALFTVHPVQIWFQLVHGVPYHKPPGRDALDADMALDGREIGILVRELHPYFVRFVEFYRNVESAKWEIRRGLRRPERQEVVADVLGMCAAEQDHDWTYPKRRVR